MNLNRYLQQHKSIESEMKTIQSLLNTGEIQQNAGEIALNISTLAGKIKMHLLMEDQYLYPGLQKSEDEKVKKLAKAYQEEMGDLAEKFTIYKDKYNTKQKIAQNLSSLKSETVTILQAIEKRIQKEEKELYTFIES